MSAKVGQQEYPSKNTDFGAIISQDFTNSRPYSPRPLTGDWLQQTIKLLTTRTNALDLPLGKVDAQQIAAHMSYEHFGVGERIRLGRGVTSRQRFMFILYGEVTNRVISGDEKTLAVYSTVGPGASLGKIDLFGGLSVSMESTVNESLHCASMTKEQITTVITKHPEAGSRLLLAMVTELSLHSAESIRRTAVMGQLVRTLEGQLQEELLRQTGHRSDVREVLGSNPVPIQHTHPSARPISTVTMR